MNVIEQVDADGIDYIWDDKKNISIRCPECDGKQNINVLSGLYNCFGCGKKGKMMGVDTVDIDDSKPVFNKKELKLVGPGAEYLKNARGIASSDIPVGYDEYRHALIFPFHTAKGKVVGHHYRYLPTNGIEPNQKYSIEGESTGFFIANIELYKKSTEVHIVEGQIDALTLAQLGINAVATCGAGNTKIVDVLPRRFERRYISFDNDVKEFTNENIKEFEESLAESLNAKVINLPGKDVNDAFLAGLLSKEIVLSRYYTSNLITKVSDFVSGMVTYLSDKDAVSGEPTGLPVLDELLGGGWRKGELTVLHAPAKSGKNSFLHYLMVPMLNSGVALGYCSRELSPDIEVLPNLLTLELKKNMWKTEMDEILTKKIEETVSRWPLFFTEGYGSIPIEELITWMKALRYANNVEHFYIDHLHYALENPEDHAVASVYIKKLKAFTKEHNVHITLIVQPNKLQEKVSVWNEKVTRYTEALGINSLKGGAAIGQALDNLLTMTRMRDDDGKLLDVVKIELSVARHKLAKPGYFYLEYDKDKMTFSEVAKIKVEVEKPVDKDEDEREFRVKEREI